LPGGASVDEAGTQGQSSFLLREVCPVADCVHSPIETTGRTPQGGPINPLLSNMMLNDLDRELKGGVTSPATGAIFRLTFPDERVMSSLLRFSQEELQLKVNRERSAVGTAWERTFGALISTWPRGRSPAPGGGGGLKAGEGRDPEHHRPKQRPVNVLAD